jgi:NADPH:quinone reductase-like Zn-dependent oxidoreductase
VQAASVNWSDTMRRRGDAYPFPTPMPFVPGGEVAGTVAALGEGVDGPPVGTPVFALVGEDGSGGYAELALANAAMVIPRPESVPAEEAAAIMVAGGTAMVLLREAARLTAGEAVLVPAAGGGVGQCVVQLARVQGAGTVIGAAGSRDRRKAALAAGADHVVDYTEAGWVEQVREVVPGGVDVALETVGGATTSQTFATLGPFGRMVVYGYASGNPGVLDAADQHRLFYEPVLNQTVTGFNIGAWFGLRPERAVAALGELIGLVARREVQIPVGEVLPLAEAARAHGLIESRHVIGKIVLRP